MLGLYFPHWPVWNYTFSHCMIIYGSEVWIIGIRSSLFYYFVYQIKLNLRKNVSIQLCLCCLFHQFCFGVLEFGLSDFVLFRWRSVPWCMLPWRTTIVWLMEERPSLSCARSSQWWRTPGCCSLTCEPLWTPGPTKQTTLHKQWLYSPDEHYRNCSWCIVVLVN